MRQLSTKTITISYTIIPCIPVLVF